MKKITVALLCCILILAGCGSTGISQEEYDAVVAERDELKKQAKEKEGENSLNEEPEAGGNIDGFEKADYEKMNSYASENGLDGTLIYIEGKVLNHTVIDSELIPLLSIVVEQSDGNRWCVATVSDCNIEDIRYNNIRAFGIYGGFSDVFNLPVIMVCTDDVQKMSDFRIELEKKGEYVEIWNFSESAYVELFTEESGNDSTNDSKEYQDGEVEILAEYTLPDSIGWYTRHFMVIKNNMGYAVDISTSSLAYGKDGSLIGADDASFDALGAGCVSIMYEAFETDAEIAYYETELTTVKSKYYESVIQDLSYVQNDIDKGAVFQVTNDGEDSAKFVEGYAMFFLNGELVSYESTYFTDDDSEIKPGKTISKQMTSREDFDTIEFYLTGRK